MILFPLCLAAEVVDVVLDVFINLPGRLDKGLTPPKQAGWGCYLDVLGASSLL